MEAAMSEWLDLELSHQLAPTEAPDELWGRVCAEQRRRPQTPHFAFPIAAVVTLILAGALYFIARGQPAPTPSRVATVHSDCLACHTTI
jgi:hypothetical protein